MEDLRVCAVDDEFAYFHCWEHFSEPIPASMLIGGYPAGVISKVYGIIEFEDRVRRVSPDAIKFVDEANAVLTSMNQKCKKVDHDE